MSTSVHLFSYVGLLVKTTTQKTASVSLYLPFIVLKKNKNLADLVPA